MFGHFTTLTTLLFLFVLTTVSSVLSAQASPISSDHSLLHDGCNPRSLRQIWLNKRQTASTGEGTSASGGTRSDYSCPSSCSLPSCHCASRDPPGNLAKEDVPQFIVFTADDAVQSYTTDVLDKLLSGRRNPNQCPVGMTYYVSLAYTNYSMVTDISVTNRYEIADHTMTHVGEPPDNEISGNLIALNALSGIPFSRIQGFRAPFLNYTQSTLTTLGRMNFTYDSSSSSSLLPSAANSDAFWPYTLDHGLANDCSVEGLCEGDFSVPGLWEVPMYSTMDDSGNPHLMDPWLDDTPENVERWMKNTFLDHYNTNHLPVGMYSHPIHLADYPGVASPVNMVNMLNNFLDWATTNSSMPNVWLVTNQQLLAWMRNPVAASQLNTLPEFQCSTPDVKENICNGMVSNEQGLLQHCISDTAGDPLNNSPFYTCYGCPAHDLPSPQVPNPPQANGTGVQVRTRIPANCATEFWDPVGARCLQAGFVDQTRGIGPNGQNLSPAGGTNTDTDAGSSGSSKDPYSNFNAAVQQKIGSMGLSTMLLGLVGAVLVAEVALEMAT